jgi:hypothetical protein
MKMGQSVPKRRSLKFRGRGITQKNAHNIQRRRKLEIKKFVEENNYRNKIIQDIY